MAIRLWGLLRVQIVWRTMYGASWQVIAGFFAILIAVFWFSGEYVNGYDEQVLGESGLWRNWLVIAGFEFLLGSSLGMLLSLPGYAAIGAATQSGQVFGLHSSSSRAFVWVHLAMVLIATYGLGIHHLILVSLRDSMARWPVGEPQAWAELIYQNSWAEISSHAHSFGVLALTLVTPVLLTTAVFDLSLRLVGRHSSLIESLLASLRPWLCFALALIALGAAWSAYPETWTRVVFS